MRECVQSTTEGIKKVRNSFYQEVEELVELCEELSAIEMPMQKKKRHRSFGPTEHNLGRSTFKFFFSSMLNNF